MLPGRPDARLGSTGAGAEVVPLPPHQWLLPSGTRRNDQPMHVHCRWRSTRHSLCSYSLCRPSNRLLTPTAALPACGSGFGSSAALKQRRHHPRLQLGQRLVVRADRDFYQILGVSRDAGGML